jgi:protein O-mannosyl-transferase
VKPADRALAPVSVGHLILLAAATWLAYANSLNAGFQFDDFNVIVLNDAVHSLQAWWASMPGIRPLLKLSYSLNWWLDPGRPYGFHLSNLIIHFGNSLLAYTLLRYWAARSGPEATRPGSVALIAALIFALHPANTEAVTYISGRSVSLMAGFYLAGLLLLLRRPGPGGSLILGLAAFALALGVKEIALTLPAALLLVVWFCDRSRLRTTWPVWLATLAGLGALLSLARYREFFATSLATRSLGDNLLTQIDGLYYLITQPLLGLHLNIDPDLPAHLALTPELAWKLAVPLALLLLAAWQWRRRPWLSLGIAWFFLHLAPTNSLLARLDVANDRQLYLAMLGPAFILAMFLQRWPGLLRWPAVLGLVFILGSATQARNADYRDEISLWRATTAAAPDKARPWNNLGYAYQIAGRKDEAIAAYRRALSLDPGYEKAKANLRDLGAEP